MHRHVIVTFGADRHFDFRLTGDDVAEVTREQARQWFDRQFEELECDIPTPMGKVLMVDRILSVARYAGEPRFRDAGWATQFARNAAVMTGREVLRVDVEKNAISY